MTALMMWMTGGGVNIFNIMIALYAIANPLKSILQTRTGICPLLLPFSLIIPPRGIISSFLLLTILLNQSLLGSQS